MTAQRGVQAARELRRLRLRVTGLITLLAIAIVAVFAFVAIRLDAQLRTEQIEADLLNEASRVASRVGFIDGEFDGAALGDLTDEMVLGLRPEFDVIRILDEQELWDSVPEMSREEEAVRVREVVVDLDTDVMADLLDLEEPWADEEMRTALIDDPPDRVYDEALRGWIDDIANEQGIDLYNPTELHGDILVDIETWAAEDAVALVADDDVDWTFDIETEAGVLMARGVPVRSGPEVRGAVVAVTDPSVAIDDHRQFQRTIAVSGTLLVLFAAGCAWLVAGRTIRPAALALEQQERFLADAAHELRTPIAAIRATAEAPASPAEQRGQLDRVAVLAAGAGQLTDDLLMLARMDADRLTLQTEPVRLDLLVESIVDDDPAFTLDLDETVVAVDPALVERLIRNLLVNARNHGGASAGSPASVEVQAGRFVLHDQGPGVDTADADSVFQRFRSGPASSGHGLGLPLARWIARAHGGDLTLEPSESGARFALRLPVPAR
ncbi:MAG: HAMP domain-containing sensor histidine kinase [Actinomycetota bacterium]